MSQLHIMPRTLTNVHLWANPASGANGQWNSVDDFIAYVDDMLPTMYNNAYTGKYFHDFSLSVFQDGNSNNEYRAQISGAIPLSQIYNVKMVTSDPAPFIENWNHNDNSFVSVQLVSADNRNRAIKETAVHITAVLAYYSRWEKILTQYNEYTVDATTSTEALRGSLALRNSSGEVLV